MVVNGGRPLKRAKRRISAGLHDFLSFPSPATGGDGIPDGPFRSRVRALLTRHARLSPPPLDLIFSPAPALAAWRISFRVGGEELGRIVEMDVIEEEVLRSRSVYCDHCRVVGWSGHPVCRKRYHFIIRNTTNPLCGYHQTCTRCGSVLHMLDSRCISCNYETTAEDVEDWAYRQLEDTSHLLHGVVHANGYGHLLRVNGREGGSKCLTGREIMSFWDRLCKMLHVRKVTVMDISKKYGMEYRLLHAVTAGHPWYGDWGYRFGSGSFALTAGAYAKAVDTLANIPLSIFFSHSRSPRTNLQGTIAFYRSLAYCRLEAVRDLFRFIMHMLQSSHERSPLRTHLKKKLDDITSSGILCAWAKHDVEKAEDSMVKVLRAVGGGRWVTWYALRGATCRAVASPELLDYCLKGLGGKVTGDGMHVVVRCNPDNNSIEYRLEAASNQLLLPVVKDPVMPSAEHLLRDLKFLYEALLNPTTMHAYKPQGTRESARSSAVKLLDCKQFVKRYDNNNGNHEDDSVKMTLANPFSFSVWCHVELVNQPKDYKAPPPELIVLPVSATLTELKLQAAKAFQETYIIFQNFQVEQLVGFENVGDDNVNLRRLLGEKGDVVKVRGRWFGDDEWKLGQFKMERGMENWIVDCACGAKDDDGERMLACDLCGVWQHTRCSGISDLDKVPVKFVCRRCLAANKTKAGAGGRNGSNGRCKDEVSSSSSIADVAGCGWMATVG